MNNKAENNAYNQEEILVELNVALPAYKHSNPKHLENIRQRLLEHGISCDILHGELVGVGGDLSWSQKPSSSKLVYYFNKDKE